MSDVKAEVDLVYAFGSLRLDLRRRELLRDGRPVALGGRAIGIVEVMVRSAGQLVTKEELFSWVWPDIAVEENALHVQISAVRRAFGDNRGLLKTEAGRGYRLLGDWKPARALAEHVQPEAPKLTPSFRSNLPLLVSELIGRSAAVRQLSALVSEYRIVTLSGPGGIGKTSLALHVVNGLRESFGGDTRLVELASISDPKLICSAVASALDLKLGLREIDLAAISTAIGETRLLVLLDNCEHVVEFAATLVEALIGACPRVCVLATSRELLRVNGEVGYQVAALDSPAEDPTSSDDLLQYSAVQLFLSRMQATHGGDVDPANLRVVAAICRRLDGIPLAIEFAASRASALGLDTVASRLEHRFEILMGGHRTALPRHQTLRATLDWSYELLPEEERRALCFASVFVGSFTIEAALAVMGEDGASATDVSIKIANLVSKSLMALEASTQPARWRLLENTRAYSRSKLDERGETDRAWSRHAIWHHGVLARELALPPKRSRAERIAFHSKYLGNVVAALEWCFSPSRDARLGAGIANFAAPLFFSLTLFVECQRWASKAIEALASEANGGRLSVELHASLSRALTFTGDGARTREVRAKGLVLAERLEDPVLHLRMIYAVFMQLCMAADFSGALALAQRGNAIAVRANDAEALSVAHAMLVNLYTLSGEQLAAEEAYRLLSNWRFFSSSENSEHFRHNHYYYLIAQSAHARNLWHRGFPEQARRLALQTVSDSEEFGDLFTTASCLMWVISIFRWVGDVEGTGRIVGKVMEYSAKGPVTALVAQGLTGQLMIERGDVEDGIGCLQDLLSRSRAGGRLYVWLVFKHYLAETFASIGRHAEAMTTIDEAITIVDAGVGFYNMPEMLRMKGQLVASSPYHDLVGAEKLFVQSIELARRQSDISWELRSATSLARLWADQGKGKEAARMLGAIYGRFTEGFDTQDVRDAKSCLDALA